MLQARPGKNFHQKLYISYDSKIFLQICTVDLLSTISAWQASMVENVKLKHDLDTIFWNICTIFLHSAPPSFCHRTKTNCNSEFEEWQRWWCIMCNLGVVSLNLQWYLYRRWAKLNRSRFLTESRVGSWFFRTHYTFKWNKDVIIVFNHKAEPIKSQKKFWIFCASAEMASFAELWAKSVQISSR